MDDLRIGVALEGGGARAVYCLGVLDRLGIKPDIYSGTSGGALVAAVRSYMNQEDARDFFFGIEDLDDVFSYDLFNVNGGIGDADPIAKKLAKVCSTKPHAECVVTVTDLDSYDLYHISNKHPNDWPFEYPYYEYVTASMTVPALVAPRLGHLVDGGVRESVPVDYLIDQGCTEIHVMCNTPYPRHAPEPLKGVKKNSMSVLLRTIDILLWDRSRNDMKRVEEHKIDGIDIYIHSPEVMPIDMQDYEAPLLKWVYNYGLTGKLGPKPVQKPRRRYHRPGRTF